MFRRRGLALFVILAVMLAGCAPTGDSFAASLAERVIIGIGDDITPPYPTPQDAELLAAEAIEAPRLPHLEAPVDYVIDVLSWEGHSGDPEGARILIRVDVFVHNSSARSFGGESYSEGRAIRCWELTVFGFHDYDSLQSSELSCPADAVALRPSPDPLPVFPDDTDDRLSNALVGATLSDVDAKVSAAFPDEFYTIKSAEHGDEIVVALGIPSGLHCVVAVRRADRSVEVLRGWPDVQLQAGEVGCDPALYLTPIATH